MSTATNTPIADATGVAIAKQVKRAARIGFATALHAGGRTEADIAKDLSVYDLLETKRANTAADLAEAILGHPSKAFPKSTPAK